QGGDVPTQERAEGREPVRERAAARWRGRAAEEMKGPRVAWQADAGVLSSGGSLWVPHAAGTIALQGASMSKRFLLAVLLVLGLACLWPAPRGAADPPKTDALSVSDLSLEVEALRTLFYIKATPELMKMLQKLSGETAQKARQRKGKASAEYQKALQELHDALINPVEGDALDKLDDKVDELQDREDPDLDDDVEITAAARKYMPELLKSLQPGQVDSYTEYLSDYVEQPLDTLVQALTDVRPLKRNELTEKYKEVAAEVAHLVAGLDVE